VGRGGRRWLAGLGSLALAGLGLPGVAAGWSTPVVLTHCAAATLPRVVFPSSDPFTRAGPGAILWNGDPATCPGAAPLAGSGIGLAPIGPDGVVGPAGSLPVAPAPAGPRGMLAATSGIGDGRIMIAAGLAPGTAGPAGLLEGRADTGFGRPAALGALPAPIATANSYLGDLALATVSARTGRVQLRLQRRAAPGLSPARTISERAGGVSAVAVGLDYRGDTLVVWAQGRSIYRRVLSVEGVLDPAERIAATLPGPRLQALISDDKRGIVAWTADTTTGGATRTRVYVDASRPGVHFGPPRLLEQYADPPGPRLPDGSLRLVRLANEGVMIAWTGMSRGHYVVRAATVSLFGPHPTSLISDPASDAILSDLATGSHGEALAVWTTVPRLAGGGLDVQHGQVVAARGVAEAPGIAVFGAPGVVAGPGPIAGPRAAIDPHGDNPIVVWEQVGPEPGIAYATRSPAAALRHHAPPAHARAGPSGLPAGAWVLAGFLAVAGAAVLTRRGRAPGRQGPGRGRRGRRRRGRRGRGLGLRRTRAGQPAGPAGLSRRHGPAVDPGWPAMLGRQSRPADLPPLLHPATDPEGTRRRL
jgi:hypothetical protein